MPKTPLPTPESAQAAPLQEYVDSRGAAIQPDRSASVLRGVKLLGLISRNGRRYREQALREAISLYEGAKVNVNHPQGDPQAPRDYRDRIGVIRGVRLRSGEGLFGSLHFNPKHPLAEQLVWDAEHAPHNVGLSHNVLARTSRGGEGLVVEAIEKVRSVDLVADPATTSGLYEHKEQPDTPPVEFSWGKLTLEQLELHRPDLLIAAADQNQDLLREHREQIEELKRREGAALRQGLILRLLAEHDLPLPSRGGDSRQLVGEAFLESLASAPDEATVEQLVAEHAAAIDSANRRWVATSREQSPPGHAAAPIRDAGEFAAAIKRR